MDKNLIKKEPLGNGFFVYVSPHHTFGTDAVLLSNFAKAKKKDHLVDLGTGCGIIPVLMMREGNLEQAIGVDISEEACILGSRTSSELGTDKLSFINSDLKMLKGKLEFGKFNIVTCNPPYKAPNAGLKNKDSVQTTARHEVACTLKDIIEVSSKLLQTGGRLCMCHRPERLSELMVIMTENNIQPKRLRLVCQKQGKSPWLVMVEGRKNGNIGLCIEPTLYVEQNDGYSEEMIRIYGSYKEVER